MLTVAYAEFVRGTAQRNVSQLFSLDMLIRGLENYTNHEKLVKKRKYYLKYGVLYLINFFESPYCLGLQLRL